MLFASVGQGWIFLIFLEFGILFALIDEIPKFFAYEILNAKRHKKIKKSVKKSKNITFIKTPPPPKKHGNKYLKLSAVLLMDFLRVICAGIILYFMILWLNYGQFRLYIILAFIIGFCLERSFIAKPITKWILWVYNRFKIKKSEIQKCPQNPNSS